MYKIKRFGKSKDQGSKDSKKSAKKLGLMAHLSNVARGARESARRMDEVHNQSIFAHNIHNQMANDAMNSHLNLVNSGII